MNERICFVLPAYNESQSIYGLILEMKLVVPEDSLIVIVDDSPNDETFIQCQRAFESCSWDKSNWHILRNTNKSGRGNAVRLGLIHAYNDKSITCFVEMDSDGSHSPEMAMKVASEIPVSDFSIGSRYMSESRIIGWSTQRRWFSKIINFALKALFENEISDWTNGLRGYSRNAVDIICSDKAKTHGFIYLSEQAVTLLDARLKISQVPIVFRERIAGKSSVTWKELFDSIIGVYLIYRKRLSAKK